VSNLERYAEAMVQRERSADLPGAGFKLVHVSELLSHDMEPDWLVLDFMERGDRSAIWAPGGKGKSFIATDLTCCIATGTTWHGREVAQGPVAYLAGEGHRGMKRRLKAWSIRHGIDLASAPIHVSDRAAPLTEDGAAVEVQAAIEGLGQHPALIVVDTLSRFYLGDENSTDQMGRYLSNVDRIAGPNCAVLHVHHVGHGADRERGASNFRPALDWSWGVSMDHERIIGVTCHKAKDHDPPEPMHFKLQTVELGIADRHGRPVTSAVLATTDAPEPATRKPMGANQRKALAALVKLTDAQRQTLEAGGYEVGAIAVLVSDWREASGIERNRWAEASKGLESSGHVRVAFPHAFLEAAR
jgi:hypothetical protein